jgi:hypothetical protein
LVPQRFQLCHQWFKPLVQSGRVFKEQESLTVWISDDDNRLPIRIKGLSRGSIKADLEEFKGLNNSFKIKKIMNISENAEAILNEIEKNMHP